MNTMHPVARVAAEICSPAFLEALPGYIAHAMFLLREKGMGEGEDDAPSALQVGDVINDTVVDCLAGVRRWGEDIPFSRFFRDAIKSEVYHLCQQARRHRAEWIEDVAEPPAPSSRRIERRDACAELVMVRELLAGNPRTKAMLDAIEDGADKRAEVAEKLGWDPDEVSLVRDIVRRRLAAAGVRWDRNKKVEMMINPEEKAARETLRRLHGVLDEPAGDEGLLQAQNDTDEIPTDAEVRAAVAALGIDVAALAARLRAHAAAYQDDGPPESSLEVPPSIADPTPVTTPTLPPPSDVDSARVDPRLLPELDARRRVRRRNRRIGVGLALAAAAAAVVTWSRRPPDRSPSAAQQPERAAATVTAETPDAGPGLPPERSGRP